MTTSRPNSVTDLLVARQALSRRGLMTRALVIAGGGALALSVGGKIAFAQDSTPMSGEMSDDMGTPMSGAMSGPFKNDIEVLNYALTLEHLEAAFYRDGITKFKFGTDVFGLSTDEQLAMIAKHEADHVDTLTSVITKLGGEPVAEGTYNFDTAYASAQAFLTTAAAVENLGVQAYDGAGQYIQSGDLLAAAGSIVAVEARHAAYLNVITGAAPAPAPFETPLAPADVLKAAGPFIAS